MGHNRAMPWRRNDVRASEASMDNDTDQPATSDGDLAAVLERLGAALREARQQRGIERAALASKLCMGEEQLSALEDADQSKLPESVFVIAQSRRVADALGLDISLLIAPLKSATPIASNRPGAEALGRLPSRPAPAGRGASVHRLPRPRRRNGAGPLRGLASTALVAGVVAAGVWAWPVLQQRLPRQGTAPVPTSAVPTKPKTPKPVAAAKPASPAVPAGELVVSASQPSWLEVQSAAGKQVLFKGSFKGERRFPVGQGLKLLAGRPDLVTVRLGRDPARALGTIDQIRWVSVPAEQPGAAAPAPAP